MRILVYLLVFSVSCVAHAYGSFSFSVSHSTNPGCMNVDYINTPYGFPDMEKGTAASVRFYFSTKSPDNVTEDSDFQETTFVPGDYENYSLAVSEFCGFPEGHYFFKYGIYDAAGTNLEFMNPDDWSEYSHAVDVDGH